MKALITLNQKFTKILLIGALSLSFLASLTQGAQELIKDGFYRHIGTGISYYRYGEVNTAQNDAFVMRIEGPMLNASGNIGYVFPNGVKLDGYADVNISVPFSYYTGHTRDERNPDNDGKRANSVDFNSYYRFQGLVGYNFLNASSERATLYLQTGFNYYLSRNDFEAIERLQGYARIPFQLEAEIMLSNSLALNIMGGVDWVLFGNHLSKATRENATGNLNVTQTKGLFGASGFVGLRYRTKEGNINAIRLMYEYFRAGNSPRSQGLSVWGGTELFGYYEPKNSTHIISLQYFWSF